MDPTADLEVFRGPRCPSLRLTRPTAGDYPLDKEEVELLKASLGAPILLLDDVSSELDVRRTARF